MIDKEYLHQPKKVVLLSFQYLYKENFTDWDGIQKALDDEEKELYGE